MVAEILKALLAVKCDRFCYINAKNTKQNSNSSRSSNHCNNTDNTYDSFIIGNHCDGSPSSFHGGHSSVIKFPDFAGFSHRDINIYYTDRPTCTA